MNRILLFLLVIFFLSGLNSAQTSKINYGNNPETGSYAEVNGINMYYEIYGEGQPLLILHGNGGSIASHGVRIEHFKKNFKVIAIDSRAHGKTNDNADSLTYRLMADDIYKLLENINIDSVFIFGQSDGAILGLLLAMDHPEKVKKVASYGANIFMDSTAIYGDLVKIVMHEVKLTTNEHKKKLYRLLAYHPNVKFDELNKIKAQVLVMCGDRDAITLEHTVKIFQNIPNSNLFVMPGATHFGIHEKADLFYKVVDDFFEKPFKKTSTVELFKKRYGN